MEALKRRIELSDVVKRFGKSLLESSSLSPQQIKVLHNIVSCRTATLGGHEEVCDTCGALAIVTTVVAIGIVQNANIQNR